MNAEILALLEREASRRTERGDWLARFLAFREEGPLSDEVGDLAVAAIRAHRDAGL